MTRTELSWKYTNENLEAIVLALEPTDTDKILAVGGSGDQAFALLEHAGEVHCVDNKTVQINYIAERAEHLKNGDYEKFLANHFYHERDEYLQNRKRAKKIRGNLKNLKLSCADIFETAEKGGFTKSYLSNTVGYASRYWYYSGHYSKSTAARFKESIACVAKKLPQNGLIYISNHEWICRVITRSETLDEPIITEDGIIEISNPKKLLPPNLIIDPELTTIARRYEDYTLWRPAVYRKTI